MADPLQPKTRSGAFLKGVATFAGLITAIAGLIGALAAVGVFEDDSQSLAQSPSLTTTQVESPSVQGKTQTATTLATSVPSPPLTTQREPIRAAINLTYAGDLDGCGLLLSVEIGDQAFVPTGNNFVATNVLVGQQDYVVTGSIVCPTAGQCEASGSGVIDVSEGRSFAVEWLAAAFAQCTVVLRG